MRRVEAQFGERVAITYVMAGYARALDDPVQELRRGLDAAAASGMPVDGRLWLEHPPASSYPACLAVKAAAEQGRDGAYLRRARVAAMCERRRLDTADALTDLARGVDGLDVARFAVDLASNAIVEAFGADLEEARTVPDEARAQGAVEQFERGERVSFPTAVFVGADGARHGVYGPSSYEDYRAAASAAGAVAASGDRPGVLEALGRFGRMATRELEEVCGLAGPPAAAELWRLATEWRVRPLRVLTGWLWELA